MVGEHRLVVANDEDDVLRVYDLRRGGRPIQSIDLSSELGVPQPGRESDLEGAATIDGVTWWIGSHARNRDGETRPNRCVLAATTVRFDEDRDQVVVEMVGAHHSSPKHGLLRAIVHLAEVGALLRDAERRAPKATGGFNIEGLAGQGRALLIGLRNPIVDGRALVLRLANPMAMLQGREPAQLSSMWIDLEGAGIRSLSRAPDGNGYIVAAGHYSGRGDFSLFRWGGQPHDEPEPLPIGVGELRVESVVNLPDGHVLALSDDGSVRRKGGRCKDRDPGDRYFRGQCIDLRQT